MTLDDLVNYFENYAVLHKQLLHNADDETKATFFAMNTDANVNEFLRSNPMDLIMIILVPDKALVRNDGNYTWAKHVAYIVLQRVPDKLSANIIAAYNNTEIIAQDFVTRLISDRHTLIPSIQDGSLHSEPVPVMGDNHYGTITMFKLVDLFDPDVDPTKWNS